MESRWGGARRKMGVTHTWQAKNLHQVQVIMHKRPSSCPLTTRGARTCCRSAPTVPSSLLQQSCQASRSGLCLRNRKGVVMDSLELLPAAYLVFHPERLAIALTALRRFPLQVAPRTVDFGKVSTAQPAQSHFVITNTLHRPLHVALDLSRVPELAGSAPLAQVVPAGATAKFPLTLRCHDVRTIRERCEFCINGAHFAPFEVGGDGIRVANQIPWFRVYAGRQAACGALLPVVPCSQPHGMLEQRVRAVVPCHTVPLPCVQPNEQQPRAFNSSRWRLKWFL